MYRSVSPDSCHFSALQQTPEPRNINEAGFTVDVEKKACRVQAAWILFASASVLGRQLHRPAK